MWILVAQRLIIEFVVDLIYFPVWWYTSGVKHAGKFCYNFFQEANMFLAPGLWLKNIFVPMFGQTDLQGRLMSIFMRIVNVIGRSIGLLIWLIITLIMFVIWWLFPVFVVYMLLQSLVV